MYAFLRLFSSFILFCIKYANIFNTLLPIPVACHQRVELEMIESSTML